MSTLKKWLTNPVRKLSAGGGGASAKGERQVRKLEGKPGAPPPPLPPPRSHSQDLGSCSPLGPDEPLTVLPAVTHRELVRKCSL